MQQRSRSAQCGLMFFFQNYDKVKQRPACWPLGTYHNLEKAISTKPQWFHVAKCIKTSNAQIQTLPVFPHVGYQNCDRFKQQPACWPLGVDHNLEKAISPKPQWSLGFKMHKYNQCRNQSPRNVALFCFFKIMMNSRSATNMLATWGFS